MRRSPILEDFAVVSKRSKASPEDPSNLTATFEDIERCRASIRKVKEEYGVKTRSKIVICAFELGEKATIKGLADRFQTDVKYIKTWLRRFNEQGFEGLKDAHRKGRTPVHDEEQILISLRRHSIKCAPNGAVAAGESGRCRDREPSCGLVRPWQSADLRPALMAVLGCAK